MVIATRSCRVVVCFTVEPKNGGPPTAGRYTVGASLCGFKEYELETEIEVLR